jgi:hypothetical protein
MPGVATGIGGFFFEAVQFFNNGNGQNHIIILKPKDCRGVVQQYVGVENKDFFHRGGKP